MPFVGTDLWKVREKWGSGLIVWPGVSVLVFDQDGKVWLGKRTDNGNWSVVGGHFEITDSAESCARREILEELGVEALELTMIGVRTDPADSYIKYPNGHEVQSPAFIFVAKVDSTNVRGDDEHSAFEWLEYEEAKHRARNLQDKPTRIFGMYEAWLVNKEFQVR